METIFGLKCWLTVPTQRKLTLMGVSLCLFYHEPFSLHFVRELVWRFC